MSLFDNLPTEIICRILERVHPSFIVAFGQTCRRHYEQAVDDTIWLEICYQIMKPHTHMSGPDGAAGGLLTRDVLRTYGSKLAGVVCPGELKGEGLARSTFFLIYRSHWVRFGWMLGWWVASNREEKAELWEVRIELSPGGDDVQYHLMAVAGPNLSTPLPSTLATHPLISVIPDSESSDYLTVDANLDGERTQLSIEGHYTSGLEGQTRRQVGLLFRSTLDDDLSTIFEMTAKPRFSRLGLRNSDGYTLGRSWFLSKTINSRFNDTPFPSPGIEHLFPDTRENLSPYLPSSPGDVLRWRIGQPAQHWSLLRLRSPSSIETPASEQASLLQPGIYMAPYGAHGWEYASVRIRALTEEDFKLDWPWEGTFAIPNGTPTRGEGDKIDWANSDNHLGPFSTLFRDHADAPRWDALRIDRTRVQPGARILEVIKITGDPNVPRGQRSIVAFLQDSLVDREHLQEMEQNLPERRDYEHLECPWPVVPDALAQGELLTPSTITQTLFSPSRGIDLPACARIGDEGFTEPQWINATVHVECRTQFSAWWHELQSVAVFTRIG